MSRPEMMDFGEERGHGIDELIMRDVLYVVVGLSQAVFSYHCVEMGRSRGSGLVEGLYP